MFAVSNPPYASNCSSMRSNFCGLLWLRVKQLFTPKKKKNLKKVLSKPYALNIIFPFIYRY